MVLGGAVSGGEDTRIECIVIAARNGCCGALKDYLLHGYTRREGVETDAIAKPEGNALFTVIVERPVTSRRERDYYRTRFERLNNTEVCVIY